MSASVLLEYSSSKHIALLYTVVTAADLKLLAHSAPLAWDLASLPGLGPSPLPGLGPSLAPRPGT